jgi:regulator of sigma E protease
VKVLKFSIGFGPRIFGFTRGETEYRVAWIPLGGFVKMAGELPEDEVPPEDVKRSFLAQPWWRRALIVAAGPAFNLIFPVFALFAVYVGDAKLPAPKVGWVIPQTPADKAGIRPGDYIRAVDGHPITSFDEISQYVSESWDKEVAVTIERDGKSVPLKITPMKQVETGPLETTKRGLLGITPYFRPALLGVPKGSAAETAGLKTFDRVLKVDGELVYDEVQMANALAKAPPDKPVKIEVIRSTLIPVGGGAGDWPSVVDLEVDKQPGEGFAALGAEGADLYVWSVAAGSPAADVGLKRGDRLLSRDGKALATWHTFHQDVVNLESKPFTLGWRDLEGNEHSSELAAAKVTEDDALGNRNESLEVGLNPRMYFAPTIDPLALTQPVETVTVFMGPVDAFTTAAKRVPEMVRQIGLVFAGLFSGKVKFESVGGPILLAQVAQSSAQAGIGTYLTTMALISVNLGLVNLLPIPILDGFNLLAALWEGVRRRPIPIKAREYAYLVGLAMLAVLVVLVFRNDITRLIRVFG